MTIGLRDQLTGLFKKTVTGIPSVVEASRPHDRGSSRRIGCVLTAERPTLDDELTRGDSSQEFPVSGGPGMLLRTSDVW
jgi:hypothetical protein